MGFWVSAKNNQVPDSLEKHHPFLTRRLNQTPVYRRIGESHISDIAGADEVFFAGLNSISLQLMLGFWDDVPQIS